MYKLKTIALERSLRQSVFNGEADNGIAHLMEEISEIGFSKYTNELAEFYSLLISLDYSHPGLTREAYMSHPIRVARLFMMYSKNVTIDSLKLCLAHNLLEVTGLKLEQLKDPHFHKIASDISLLTVIRDIQWDQVYKQKYYSSLSKIPHIATVKVLDKLYFIINFTLSNASSGLYFGCTIIQ